MPTRPTRPTPPAGKTFTLYHLVDNTTRPIYTGTKDECSESLHKVLQGKVAFNDVVLSNDPTQYVIKPTFVCPDCDSPLDEVKSLRKCGECNTPLYWDKETYSYHSLDEGRIWNPKPTNKGACGSQDLIDHCWGDVTIEMIKSVVHDYTQCHSCKNPLEDVTSVTGDYFKGTMTKTTVFGNRETDRKIPLTVRITICGNCYQRNYSNDPDFKVLVKTEPNRITIPEKESSRSITLSRLDTKEMSQVSKDKGSKLKNEREVSLFKSELDDIWETSK